MDRDDLNTVLSDLGDDTLSVKPDGTVCTSDGNEWACEEVAEAVADLEGDLNRLRRVLAWARTGPECRRAGDPTNTGGKADANGVPY